MKTATKRTAKRTDKYGMMELAYVDALALLNVEDRVHLLTLHREVGVPPLSEGASAVLFMAIDDMLLTEDAA